MRGDRFVRRLGNGIGIGLSFGIGREEQAVEFLGREAGQVEVDIELLQFHEFRHQSIIVPFGKPVGLVIRNPIGLNLSRRQANATWTELLSCRVFGRLVPGMADDDDTGLVNNDGLPEAKLLDGLGHCIDSRIVDSWVVWNGLMSDSFRISIFMVASPPVR